MVVVTHRPVAGIVAGMGRIFKVHLRVIHFFGFPVLVVFHMLFHWGTISFFMLPQVSILLP